MVGFFEKVGAVPSTWGWGGASTAAEIFSLDDVVIINIWIYFVVKIHFVK